MRKLLIIIYLIEKHLGFLREFLQNYLSLTFVEEYSRARKKFILYHNIIS